MLVALDSLFEMGDGIGKLAFLGKERAQVSIGFSVVRLDAESLPETGFRQIDFLGPDIGNSQVVVCPCSR